MCCVLFLGNSTISSHPRCVTANSIDSAEVGCEISELGVITGVGVMGNLQERGWLKSNRITENLPPAWVMTHGSCCPGPSYGQLDGSESPFSAVVERCYCEPWNSCQFQLFQTCQIWFLLSLLPSSFQEWTVWILINLLHVPLNSLIPFASHLELTQLNNHRLGGLHNRL